jgi:hypothetical protein
MRLLHPEQPEVQCSMSHHDAPCIAVHHLVLHIPQGERRAGAVPGKLADFQVRVRLTGTANEKAQMPMTHLRMDASQREPDSRFVPINPRALRN